MPFTILTGKELTPVAPRPLLLCRIVALDGDTVYLSTAAATGATSLTYDGHAYQCKVQDQSIDAIIAMSAQGYDVPGTFVLTLADGDFALWNNHALAHGWKGATLTVYFTLYDAITATFATDDPYAFEFTVESADIQANGVMRVPTVARNSMTRLKVPNVSKQRRCSWVFPANADERLEALINPTSAYYQCGYSKGITGGVGNYETGTTPYTTCDYTREGCTARGMFNTDSAANATRRFSGDTWLPDPTWTGRDFQGKKVFGFNTPGAGGVYYPIVYGRQWVDAVSLAPAAEANSIRAEAVVCMAMHGNATVEKVVINGHLIPQNNADVLFTWRYVTQGGRTGAICTDAIFDGNGDPHGSMCVIEWVVPKELAGGGSPSVRVLVSGPPILMAYAIDSSSASGGGEITLTLTTANTALAAGATVNVIGNSLAADGTYTLSASTYGPPGTLTLDGTSATGSGTGGSVFFYPSPSYSAFNPVWQLMDMHTLGPWRMQDFDVSSWVESAAYCNETIDYLDMDGNTSNHARFQSSFALENATRQTLAQAVLGLRMNAGIILSRNPSTGKLGCAIERTLAEQQGSTVSGSNYDTPVSSVLADGTTANGYLAHKFSGDNIERGSFRVAGRAINDSPTRIQIQFQDQYHEYQTDSLSLIDPEAFAASGLQDVSSGLQILGISNFDQAIRRGNVEQAKSHYGNTRADAGGTMYIEFTTGMTSAHLVGKVGSICGIDYEQLGL